MTGGTNAVAGHQGVPRSLVAQPGLQGGAGGGALPMADRPYDVVERDRRAEMVAPPPRLAQLMHPLEGSFRGSGTLDPS